MSLSEKEKRWLQAKRIKHMKYKATGLYLYHPGTDSWIPAQCDDEGRLVIDPADLDTRYLKLDGSNKMLADLLPNVGEEYYLGSEILKWNAWFSEFNVDEIIVLTGGNINLETDNSCSIGSSSERLRGVDAFRFECYERTRAYNSALLDWLNGVLRLPNTRPASPVAGDTRYDPTTDTFEIYDGAAWKLH